MMQPKLQFRHHLHLKMLLVVQEGGIHVSLKRDIIP
jgi:hypothetical protein